MCVFGFVYLELVCTVPGAVTLFEGLCEVSRLDVGLGDVACACACIGGDVLGNNRL